LYSSKIFTIAGSRLRISVVETTNPDAALKQQASLTTAMTNMVASSDDGLDDILLFVVDILNEKAIYLSSSSSADSLVQRAWGVPMDTQKGRIELDGVLSRKKQIIPALENAQHHA
jgi:manganese-dependent inorganic pyrophosphatase